MSNQSLEKRFDILINLLETLPKRMCDELEKRHELNKALQVQSEIEFYSNNADEINEFMYGFKKNLMDDNNGSSQPLEPTKKKGK